ncbi:hypothetical protein G6F46_003223 [Rhizopus delemar]|nr:hypothetical protein G6F54_002978 [Rhizopus delemar]KAG1514266.1 hypothetical protein G6F53_003806 [Rhizopus delemar]KAG1557315.1 hypothetical protein G6F49_005512 [Rhizopus delemar]KAG1600471.1 hypothetical protein G6F47_004566 [Rhizopus delemar]KAG1619359.1 hypothetical protein G6F46_003223 [Rhizopus delemar]
MFSIARYNGEEENDTRTFEKKQDRLNKLNSKVNNKRKNESAEKKSEKKKKQDLEEQSTNENVEEEKEEEIEKEQEKDDDQKEEKKKDLEEKEVPTLEAFPNMVGRKAKHSKEEINMLKNMGVPDWLLHPTVVSPKDTCELDQVGLSPWLVQRCKDIGLSSLFAVQMAVIPVFLRHKTLYDTIKVSGDLCISAPTGSGKTMAYALPIVDILSKRVVKRLRAVVVLPTRDLVVQVKETFDAFVKGTDLVVAAVSGQQSFTHEQHVLVGNEEESYPGGKSRVDILIATPGRLIDHLNSTPNFTLQHVRFLVIDEADRLLNQSFNDWLNRILLATNPVVNADAPLLGFKTDKNGITLPDAIAPTFLQSHYKLPVTDLDIPKAPFIQKLLFSATLTKNPAKIAGLHLNEPEYISVQHEDEDHAQREYTTPEGLKEYMIIVSTEKKPLTVIYLLHQLGVKSGLCFTKSVESTERLQTLINAYEALQPEEKRIKVKEYSSELRPTERKAVLKQFKDGEIDLLICSDLIGRGIDLDSVEYVVSYDAPAYMDKYIHRVGRTARAGREGIAYTLVEKPQARHFKEMMRHAGHLDQIQTLNIEKEKIQELVPDYEKAMENENTESLNRVKIQENNERETMTLKDRQEAMNKIHPFGLPVWKPALYKKSRSIVRKANKALHSSPSSSAPEFLNPGNILWLFLFGWWLSLIILLLSIVLFLIPSKQRCYGRALRELSFYLFWPFGKYVERQVEITPAIQTSHSFEEEEMIGLLSWTKNVCHQPKLATFLNLGLSGFVYYVLFFFILAPLLLCVSILCWMAVVSIPMAKLNYILVYHLYRHPLSLRFKSSPPSSGLLSESTSSSSSMILLCTYQAIGLQYYKYTFDGINIIFINLMPLVFFVILDDYLFNKSLIHSSAIIFALALASVIPLSYFIGMAISSISAQSSMGVGAVITATFGSIIEIILYAVSLVNGKSILVEGALIGSFLAGVLLMPGCSMISGGIKRKEQRFNAKSAGVTSTMLIMAIIGALTPTLFYQMFGSFELKCIGCRDTIGNGTIACSRCYYDQMNPTKDPVYQNNVKPLMWICVIVLPSVYIIGLIFSLRTHVDMVWKSTDNDYLKNHADTNYHHQPATLSIYSLKGKASEDASSSNPSSSGPNVSFVLEQPTTFQILLDEEEDKELAGHDSPNWSKSKSFIILFGCTLLYSIIAEILINTIDEVIKKFPISEKFLGLTLFALVPNITEFMNAISFALYDNIVLSMEIGSAYALQVCLLKIPVMVAFSAWYNYGKEETSKLTLRDFRKRIYPGGQECCHYSNKDCTPNGNINEEMEFSFQFQWGGIVAEGIKCAAGDGIVVYGEQTNYWAECTDAATGETKRADFYDVRFG